ncbi:MFS transporter [Paenibacillus sp. SYP-B4298]|uniref:MFS transporter n=1 Tax=Paenibacillus sp. SYP-B4298 TaxID=2996034 RepID=UPI0022DE3F2C|nr:MFS transporter [Paenibacillus sp. SYP-B4298]
MEMKPRHIWNPMYTALFLLNAIVNVSFYMVSTTLSLHLVGIGMTLTAAGAIIGAMPLAAMLIRPFSGWVCDRFAKRRLLLLCLLLNGICVAGYGLAGQEAVYMALRVVHGLSFGMMTTVTMALVAAYIPEGRMGEGMGYFGLAQTLAMAAGPGIGLALAEAAGSSRMYMAAALCIVASLGLLPLIKERREEREQEARAGLRLRASDFLAREALLYAVIALAISSANGIEVSYIAMYGESLGIVQVGWYFTLSALALFTARLICGRLADRRGFSFVFYPGMMGIALAFILLSQAQEGKALGLFAAAAVLKALGVGAVQPALQAAVVQAVTPQRRGAATSTFFIGADLGQAVSPALAGGMIEESGYSLMFRIYALPVAVVVIGYAAVRGWRRRNSRSSDRG